MANSAQARKRVRQAQKSRLRNASFRSMVRTCVKRVLAAVETGDQSAAEDAFQKATSALDRAVSKGLYHKNKAARSKSRLSKKVKALAA